VYEPLFPHCPNFAIVPTATFVGTVLAELEDVTVANVVGLNVVVALTGFVLVDVNVAVLVPVLVEVTTFVLVGVAEVVGVLPFLYFC
jgi:hypothetical protein